MIHVFSVVVETFDDTDNPATIEEVMGEVEANLAWESLPLGILSVKTAPITGVQRQHLIGDTDNETV